MDSGMLDLETMGTGPNAAVVQIGFIPFNLKTGKARPEFFEVNVDLLSSLQAGGEVDQATVRALMKLSKAHYDSTCRAAGEVGGFLYGWMNLLESQQPSKDPEPGPMTLAHIDPSGTFRELDLTLKLTEGARLTLCTDELALIRHYEYDVRAALKRANEITDWRVEL